MHCCPTHHWRTQCYQNDQAAPLSVVKSAHIQPVVFGAEFCLKIQALQSVLSTSTKRLIDDLFKRIGAMAAVNAGDMREVYRLYRRYWLFRSSGPIRGVDNVPPRFLVLRGFRCTSALNAFGPDSLAPSWRFCRAAGGRITRPILLRRPRALPAGCDRHRVPHRQPSHWWVRC